MIVEGEENRGLEGWRLLSKRFDPSGGSHDIDRFTTLASPKRCAKMDEVPRALKVRRGQYALPRVHDSLQRLGTGHLDIVYIHDIAPDHLGDAWTEQFEIAMNGAARALTELREAGREVPMRLSVKPPARPPAKPPAAGLAHGGPQ